MHNMVKRKLFLFDVDGTLADSGQVMKDDMKQALYILQKSGVDIGIVGGGKIDTIERQIDGVQFSHYFSESGCVYYKSNEFGEKIEEPVYVKNIRDHTLYPHIQTLIRVSLDYLSRCKHTISGNFIDLRTGIVYISLVGMSATISERSQFIESDNKNYHRKELLSLLVHRAKELGVNDKLCICEGGQVGIAIHPIECDKTQVMEHLTPFYDDIHYFGDKYKEGGNDHNLIHHTEVKGVPVDSPNDTLAYINTTISSFSH